MANISQIAIALKALQEVQQETAGLVDETPQAGADPLDAFLSIPETGLVLGLANDGQPILLDWSNPAPGPILVTGDRGSGKTAFLQGLLQVASLTHSPKRIQFMVVTDFPAEWSKRRFSHQLAQVYPAYEIATADVIFQLASWVGVGGDDRAVFLLWDGLDAILHLLPDAQEALRFLLLRGPAAGLWPVVTASARQVVGQPGWLELFRTRIYGRIADPLLETELTPLPGANLNTLTSGGQFCMRANSRWLRFWLMR